MSLWDKENEIAFSVPSSKSPWYHLNLNITQGPPQSYHPEVRLINGNMDTQSLDRQDVNAQENT